MLQTLYRNTVPDGREILLVVKIAVTICSVSGQSDEQFKVRRPILAVSYLVVKFVVAKI